MKGSTVRSKGTLAGGSKSLTIEGNAVLGNTVSDLNSLTVTGTTKLDIGNLVTVGEQSYGGAVTLGADTTLAGSTVKMLGGVTGREHPLSIVGDAVLGGTSSGLTTLTVSKSTTITGGEVRSTGAQTYGDNLVIHNADASLSTLGGAVMVAGATTLSKRLTVSSGAGDVSFSGRIDGPGELEVNSSGITTFSQAVGAGTALASLTTDALGQTLIEGGSVKTSGEQSYGDAVTLSVDTTLKGSTVRSKGTLAGGSKSLTIEGNAVLGNTVSDLNSLTVTGTTKLDIGNLVTVGEQSYGGGVTLGTDTTLTGSTVKMLKGGTGVEHALSIFGDAVLGGTLSGLTTLTVSKSTTITGRTVTSSGKQEYLGDATIAGATTLSSGAGDVTFHGKVFGPSSLSLNSQGTVTFNDAVGGFNDAVHADTPLASLTTDAGGKLLINGGLVRTTGRQSYADRVELGGDTTLHVSASDARILTVKGEDGFSLAYYDNAVELREGGSITNQSGSRLKVVVDGPGSVDLLGLKPKDGSSTTPSLAELVTKAAETLDPSSTAFAGLIGWTTRNDLQGEVTVITDVANGGAHSSDAQHLVGIAAPKIEIAKFGGYDERADIGVLADSVLLMTRALPISRLDGMVDNGIVKATASLPAEAVAHHPYVPALTMLPVDDGRIGASQPYYYGGADKDSWIPVELGVDARQQGLVVFLPPRDAGREASSLFLGGPKELKPIQTGSSSVSYRSYSLPVIYNGEIISSAQFAGFEASLVQLLSDIRREQLERGYANESIPARLRTGVVMETGLGSPAVDEFEGVALPARCTGTVSASGMSCAN
ncbi:hypothetical protein CCR84_11880 [Rhodocyclus purpureus]|nr:hypothetical protein [Rhodocyclus purpureus]